MPISVTKNKKDEQTLLKKVSKEKLLLMSEKDRALFEKMEEPRLVPWDIWAGNVFDGKDKITARIDFKRYLWEDKLLEVGFRTYGYQKVFFEGYDITA